MLMKRYLILGVTAAVLVLLLLQWHGHRQSPPAEPNSTAEALAVTNPPESAQGVTNNPMEQAKSVPVTNQMGYEDPETIRAFNESPDVPISFYGLVVDQDSNALQNVKVDLRITQWQPTTPLGENIKNIQVRSETAADGSFNFSSMNGHSLTVLGLTKEGYEPEFMRPTYGEYGPHGGSPEKPEVFKIWSTNLDQPLITGEKSFVITPDGRHYAIDLIKGTIVESDDGDLMAWIKRPEKVGWRERYDWSCELMVPAGGLREESQYYMFTAPEAGYTNLFAFNEPMNTNGWSDGFERKRFYVRLRNGQMYGRISVDLYADYHGKQPALIRVSYAVNPSGSRILREQVPVPPSQDMDAGTGKFPAQLTWPPR